jgi:creatinine amidohydrolase
MTIELAYMTWREVEAARDRGAAVLVPIGTHEQNGSFGPMATDGLLVFELTKRIAAQTDAVVAPLVSYGYSPRHRNFPGTISLRPDTLRMLIYDICEALVKSGFDHILLVNAHATNEPIMEHAGREIRERHGVMMGYINPVSLAEKCSDDLYPRLGSAHGHGDERVTSMLNYCLPGVVRMDARPEPVEWLQFEGLTLAASHQVRVGKGVFGLYMEVHDFSPSGGNGNPAAVDIDKGAEVVARVVSMAVEYVKVFLKIRTSKRP